MTKKQLIDELAGLRQEITELKSLIIIAQNKVIKLPNPKTLELMRYSADELAKMPFVNLIHHESTQIDNFFSDHVCFFRQL